MNNIPDKYKRLESEKKFSDWEIAPWELLIFYDNILGEGEFGKVYLSEWRKTKVASKIVNAKIPEDKKELFIKEFDTMTKIHHPNIIQLLGYVEDPFIIVMEYFDNGDLLSYISKNITFINKKKQIACDILKGLTYLHNRRPQFIIHRDLKSHNIFITKSGTAKIGDFGLSKILDNRENLKISPSTKENEIKKKDLTTPVGSKRYMAPEIKNNLFYNEKSDIWSCGVIFIELFECGTRYTDDFVWHFTPSKIQSIISSKMLKENPEDRADAIDIINEFDEFNNIFYCCFKTS